MLSCDLKTLYYPLWNVVVWHLESLKEGGVCVRGLGGGEGKARGKGQGEWVGRGFMALKL